MNLGNVFLWLLVAWCSLLVIVECQYKAPVKTVRRGHKDRVEYIKAEIQKQHLDKGTSTNPATRAYAQRMGTPNDDAGHLIAQRLGGSGRDTYNIVPQNKGTNRGSWRSRVERPIYDDVNKGNTVIFEVWPKNTRYEEFDLGKDGQPSGGAGEDDEEYPEPERPPPRHIDKYIRPECPCLTKRYTIAVLTCVGFIISFGMRCNMGMAKLEFNTSERAIKKVNSVKKIPFHWSVGMESAVDSSFFWGYLVTQVPGGFLASKYPANRVFGAAIATSSFLNLLLPTAADSQPVFIIIVRVLQGLVEGVTYPACHGIWRYWAPPLERSRLATIAFCGSYAGVVLGMPLSGVLTAGIGWQAPFYFYGVVGLIWYLTWLWLAFERPSKHPTISARELFYIQNSLGKTTQGALPTIATTPWKKFFTSMPVYAIIVANFCRSWNFYLLVLFQASYLSSAFGLKIQETGFLGALPHLLMTIIVPFGGMLADYVRKNQILTTTNVRKVFNCGGFGMEGLFFIVVAYSKTAVTANLALTLGVAFSGFAISGYNVNHLDIAPRYASILMGMSNGIGTIAGLICPIVIDHITNDHEKGSWKVVFLMAATVHMCGVTFYAIFASGELQPWAEPEPTESQPWDPMENALEPTETTRMDGKMVGYGTLDTGGGYANHVMSAENVQPPATDAYMYQQQEPPRPPPPVGRPPPPNVAAAAPYGNVAPNAAAAPYGNAPPYAAPQPTYDAVAAPQNPYVAGTDLFSAQDYQPARPSSSNPFLN